MELSTTLDQVMTDSPGTSRSGGCFAPLPTFFDENLALDLPALGAHVRWLKQAGMEGLLVLGSTAEVSALTTREKEACLETVIGIVGGHELVACLAGTCFDELLDLGRLAGDLGYERVLIAPPYHPRSATREGRGAFVRDLATAVGLPFLIYHFPAQFGGDLDELVTAVADHPLWCGIKESSGQIDPVEFRRRTAGRELEFYPGGDARILACLEAGAVGSITAAANVAPELVAALYQAWRAGRVSEARAFQERLTAVRSLYSAGDPQAVAKYLLGVRGLAAGTVRSPLVELDEDTRRDLSDRFRALGSDYSKCSKPSPPGATESS